uniref:Uncharacterized protein n=1 Tax=Peronospora matthiolae TaxID=2874970 RepID=A0AAV1TDK7_9STRA
MENDALRKHDMHEVKERDQDGCVDGGSKLTHKFAGPQLYERVHDHSLKQMHATACSAAVVVVFTTLPLFAAAFMRYHAQVDFVASSFPGLAHELCANELDK